MTTWEKFCIELVEWTVVVITLSAFSGSLGYALAENLM